jgi:hypothetical protein
VICAVAGPLFALKPDLRARAWDVLFMAMKDYSLWYDQYPYDSRGPDYALYSLKKAYMACRSSAGGPLGLTLPEQDYELIDRSGPGVSGKAPVWDDGIGRMAYDALDYLNWPPERVKASTESTVLLSYDTSLWRRSSSVPYCVTGVIAPPYANWQARYYPWVRPRRITGLPAASVYELSEYGRKWQVRAGRWRCYL